MKTNNELKHYGILGMHWGIRRYQPYSTVPRESGKGGKEIGEARRKYRLHSAADAADRDASNLRQQGYDKEAAAVQKVADRNRQRAQKKFEKDVNKKWVSSYNKATDSFNKQIRSLNKQYNNVDLGFNGYTYTSDAGKNYLKEVDKLWTSLYSSQLLKDLGEEPISNGRDWVNDMPFMNRYKE